MLFSEMAAGGLVASPLEGRMVSDGDVRWKKINELLTKAMADTSKATMRQPGQSGRINWMDCYRRSLLSIFFAGVLRDLRIAEILFVKIKQVQTQAVFHLALAQIVQVRLPVAVVRQIFRHCADKRICPYRHNPSPVGQR